MAIHSRVPLGDGTLPEQMTGFVGNDSAVCVWDSTTPDVPRSSLKAGIVACLAGLFALSPTLAIALARVVRMCWGRFPEV